MVGLHVGGRLGLVVLVGVSISATAWAQQGTVRGTLQEVGAIADLGLSVGQVCRWAQRTGLGQSPARRRLSLPFWHRRLA